MRPLPEVAGPRVVPPAAGRARGHPAGAAGSRDRLRHRKLGDPQQAPPARPAGPRSRGAESRTSSAPRATGSRIRLGAAALRVDTGLVDLRRELLMPLGRGGAGRGWPCRRGRMPRPADRGCSAAGRSRSLAPGQAGRTGPPGAVSHRYAARACGPAAPICCHSSVEATRCRPPASFPRQPKHVARAGDTAGLPGAVQIGVRPPAARCGQGARARRHGAGGARSDDGRPAGDAGRRRDRPSGKPPPVRRAASGSAPRTTERPGARRRSATARAWPRSSVRAARRSRP